MADRYDSVIGKIFGFFNGSKRYAVTFGQTTFYSVPKEEVEMSPSWIVHENKHKEQYKRDGFFNFLFKYIYYQFKYGYKDNPYEVEARKAAEGYLNSLKK